ncbi:hypothetical protein MMC24_006203 [Lignoscripta atroalba]|nr:hypothetical protein [Lignoscripta atroalba]
MAASSSAKECSRLSPGENSKASAHSPRSSTSPSPSPSSRDSPDSLLSRLVFTPLLFISFLLSLLLIDNRNHNSVTRHHSPPNESPASILGWIFGLRWKNRDNNKGHQEAWFWRAKHRRMARMEFSEAFEIRKLVLVGLVLGAVVSCMVGMWLARWVLRGMAGWLRGD